MSLEKVCENYADDAVIMSAGRFMAGHVEDQNLDWPPSPARFSKDVEKCQGFIESKRRPQLEHKPKREYVGDGFSPFEKRKEALNYEFAGRVVLGEGVDHTTFIKRCKERFYPVGSLYVGANSRVYAPVGYQLVRKENPGAV